MTPNPSTIGQAVRRCRQANEAMRRAWRCGGFTQRNMRRFKKHWKKWNRLTSNNKLAVVRLDEIHAPEFSEPLYS
jgi:hypothetical protein